MDTPITLKGNNMFNKKNMKNVIIFFSFFCVLSISQNAYTYNQNPSHNWGNTCGLDPILPPPGLYFSNYVVNYSSNDFKNYKGRDLELPNGDDPDLDVVAYAPQLIYVHNQKVFNDYSVGFQLFPTIIQSYNLNSDVMSADSSTFGDMIFGPWIGRTEKIGQNCRLHWLFEFDTYCPIGEYDKDDDINPGANFWTFEPWLAFSFQLPYGITLATRQQLAYNTENHDTDIQAGCLYHCNYSLWKSLDFIDPKLQLGIVGYYGKQLEDDELNGNDIDRSKEEIFAIGPGLSWTSPTGTTIRLKTYFETEAENRAEGSRIVLRIIQKIW
mgnify:CR=1 FL=1